MSKNTIQINEAFRQALLQEDDLGRVIRAHIYIEHAIDELIDLRVQRPKYYKEARLNYNQRLHVAAALGVIRINLLPPLKKLGKLRNAFAHDPTATITRTAETEFLNSFSKLDSSVMKAAYARQRREDKHLDLDENFKKESTPFRFVIAAIVLNTALVHCRTELKSAPPGFVID